MTSDFPGPPAASMASMSLQDPSPPSNPEDAQPHSLQIRAAEPPLPEVPPRCVLEDFTQCSKSHLWRLMMSFYDRKGPESWSQGIVPHFITCNAFIGRSYAKVLLGFLRDSMAANAKMPLDPNEPLYIIELGTGSGKFSYLMLKALEEMADVSPFPISKIVYVMTDFTENNFNFWSQHPALKSYFERGTLDAGIFDAVNDDKITLRSGKVIRANTVKNPICIVANYLFDTLYHDIFQVSEGLLMEGLVSTGSTNTTEPDPLDPAIIQRLSNEYKYVPITENYYSEEEGDEMHAARILKWYRDFYTEMKEGASILIPIGALRALRRLTKFSNGRAIIISGDKGNNNPEQFVGLMDPHIAVHGSFSLMVNYHAIGMWFTSKGGFAIHNPQEDASLKVSCFVLHAEQDEPSNAWNGRNVDDLDNSRMKHFPHLCSAFHDAVNIFGPNDFFVMQKTLKEDMANPPLRSIISLLKLSDWDADVFFKFRDNILNQVPSSGQKLRSDLCRGIPRLWQNYYELDVEKDIAFEIGRVYYGVKDYGNALTYYKLSTTLVGEHHVTYHNQGLCYYSLGQLEQALELFRKAHAMNKDYEKARSWSDRVQKELNDRHKTMVEVQATPVIVPETTVN